MNDKSWLPSEPRGSIITFKGPRGRWRVGIWVRGGDEAELAEFVATSNFFRGASR